MKRPIPLLMKFDDVVRELGTTSAHVKQLIENGELTKVELSPRVCRITTESVNSWVTRTFAPPLKPDEQQPCSKPASFKYSATIDRSQAKELPRDMRSWAKYLSSISAIPPNGSDDPYCVIPRDSIEELTVGIMAWAYNMQGVVERWEAVEVARERREIAIEKARTVAEKRVVEASIGDSFDPHGYFVYILWGDDPERPVYIGQSINVISRLGTHLSDRQKRSLTRRIQLIKCCGKRSMDSTEMRLIAEYKPLLNIAGNVENQMKGA